MGILTKTYRPNIWARIFLAETRASRGTYLLMKCLNPSSYIHEIVEIAGEDVRFETSDGQKLDKCPKCIVGNMAERTRADGSL